MKYKLIALALLLPLALGSARAENPKPLTVEDQKKVEELLKNFDPKSYSVKIPVEESSGKVVTKSYGAATGLTSVKQTSVERKLTDAAKASTNTNNNIFKVGATASTNTNNNVFKTSAASTNTNNNVFKNSAASTNTNNNVFRVASTNTNNNVFKVGSTASTNTNNNIFKLGSAASTNTNNNIFVNGNQAQAAEELNAILQKQYK